MSASDHLSGEQFKVYRGIQSTDPQQWEEWTGEKTGFKVDTHNLGNHWSKEPAVATSFAREPGSVIVHGTVPSSAVVTDKGEQVRMGADDIHGEYSYEKEVPVRSGSTVKVHRVDKVKNGRVRKRTYNPPRQMKA